LFKVGRGIEAAMFSFVASEDPAAQLRVFRGRAPGAYVQTLDAEAVAGATHVRLALKQTVELLGHGQLLAKKPEVDLLLRISGTAQIAEALRLAGSKPRSPAVLVVFGTRGAVSRGVGAISKATRLAPLRGISGRKAGARITRKEVASVAGLADPRPFLLAEKAALLKR
jgi:hypothetical protein